MKVRSNTKINKVPFAQKPFVKKLKTGMKKVARVALGVLKCGIAVGCYAVTPNVFAIGFVVGIAFHKQTQEVVDKIVIIWKKQTWQMAVITGVAAFLSLPAAGAMGSFIVAAYIGSKLSGKAQETLNQQRITKV